MQMEEVHHEQNYTPETPVRSPQTGRTIDISSPGTGGRSLLSNVSLATNTTTPLTEARVSKLSSIIGDSSFEAKLKEKSQKRKEKDEECLTELQASMTAMDNALTQEIKRRIEMQKVMEDKTEEAILQMEMRLNGILEDRLKCFGKRLDMLDEKVEELNTRLIEEGDRIPKDLELKGREVKDLLEKFHSEFATEKRERLTREARIMKQLNGLAQDMSEKWKIETAERVEVVNELSSQVNKIETSRQDSDDEFERLISTEIQALKDELQRESMERRVEDDEIVEALNRYTENLRNSLAMLE
jgi:hypothetical protein